MNKITHEGAEVEEFFKSYIDDKTKVLFIGTVGFNDAGNYFPILLGDSKHIDYKFLIEVRPIVPEELVKAGATNKGYLESKLTAHSLEFKLIEIVASDNATTAGRNAVAACMAWLHDGYTDIMVDTTSMSRGVCFSIAKQVIEFAHQNGIQPHILVAERDLEGVDVQSMSNDVACYMHGFQKDMETDAVANALKMWVPQLSERAPASLEQIFSALKPDEVCPVLPFPSSSPRRADELLLSFRTQLMESWDVNLLDVIYAQEADPTDLYETIKRLHMARERIFEKATTIPVRTVLSPTGWRIGSIGMLLAALELDLPIIYTENIGYTITGGSMPKINCEAPPSRWHIWILPPSYA